MQADKLMAYILGMQTSMAHILHILDSRGVVPMNESAQSLRKTAEIIPEGAQNRDMIAKAIEDLASMVEHASQSAGPPNPGSMFQVIDGGRPDDDSTPPNRDE